MTDQPHRLSPTPPHKFAGLIDRSRPLTFRLDGRAIAGFAGDSVLSAALAAGIDTVGLRGGWPMALSMRFAPPILPARHAGNAARALPMDRVAATNGASYLTAVDLTQRHRLVGRLLRPTRSLGLKLDGGLSLARPWLDGPADEELHRDLVVVGGGVAGMAAALAGSKAGLSVMLFEASATLGGNSRLFGTQDGEETPDVSIRRLSAAVDEAGIPVQLNAEVTALRPGLIRVHIVDPATAEGRIALVHAPRIVLATGAIERLPVFPGNRLPGVAGALEAFELASRYGVWPGRSALIATASSPAYRLAMLASDAGTTVTRILDARAQPQSRFIEFAKAYGITMAPGLVPASAAAARKGLGITLMPHLAIGRQTAPETPLAADRLIVCGGWQPDLTLWHMAGGHSHWNAATNRLEPLEGPGGVALAGSAAGYVSRHAAIASGDDVVDMLLGRDRKPVHEVIVDSIHETPDAPCPIGPASPEATAPAMLDGGLRLVERQASPTTRRKPWRKKPQLWSLADTTQPLDIAAIAAGVQLGAIPEGGAGIVAEERVGMVVIGAGPLKPRRQSEGPALIPPYLTGRFGNDAELWLVTPLESRMLDTGSLIHRSSQSSDPREAVGVILCPAAAGAIALIAHQPARGLTLRDHGRAINIRLVTRYTEGMDSGGSLPEP